MATASKDAFAAELVAASAAGLAALAAERLLPRLTGDGVPGRARVASWREQLADRLADLSLALAEGRPRVFADQVAWTKVALTARKVPLEDLAASLQCLREVLAAELPPAAATPAVACVDAALGDLARPGAAEPSALSAASERGRLAARYVLALLEGERRRAATLLLEQVRAGRLTVREALLDVCLPAQRELGRMWHVNEITVAEEHFVTATTNRVRAQLLAQAPEPVPLGRTVVGAALEDDGHDVGLGIVSDLLELEGFRVVDLGARVPVADLVWAAGGFGADLVMLSATLGSHRGVVARAVAALAAGHEGVRVLVGGPAFVAEPEAWSDTGADTFVRHARDVPDAARALCGLPPG